MPAVPVREQVMNNYLVPASELTFASMWNGAPVTIRHPKQNSGSANVPNPDVAVIGRFYNAAWDDEEKRITGEYWIDVDEAMKYVEGQYILNSVYLGQVLETSTGYWADEERTTGEFLGRNYATIHRNLRPDHIAILVDEIGACSVADGCGVNRNSLVHKLWVNECLYENGGRGSGNFGHLGRPGQVGGSRVKSVKKQNPHAVGKKLTSEVNAYYVSTKARADKYRNGFKGSASLMSKAKAEDLFDSMTRGGFDPVIFEIKLKKGAEYTRITSSSIVVPSVSSTAIHEIDIETLKKRSTTTFKNTMNENDCGCPQLNAETQSMKDRIEKIQMGFYHEFMKPQESIYIEDIFDGYVIVEQGDQLYKVMYRMGSDGEPVFDPQSEWTQVEEQYVEQNEEVVPNVLAAGTPEGLKAIYERVYADTLKKVKGDKAKAAKIAWGAVKRAGWKQDENGKWIKEKGDKKSSKNNRIVKVSANTTKENHMSKKFSVTAVLDMLRGKGVEVQVNNEEDLEDVELLLDEEEEETEEVGQETAAPQFSEVEVNALKKLASMDWTKVNAFMDKLPSVMEMAQNAEAEKTTRKNELVTMITNSASNTFTKEELEAMTLPTLTKLNAQLNINYAGLGGATFVNSSTDEEGLGLPSVSFVQE